MKHKDRDGEPIESIDFSFRTETPHGTGDATTRLVVAGQDLTAFCRRVTFTAAVGNLNTAELELYTRKGFELVAPLSVVYVAIHAVPGWKLLETRAGDRAVYRVVKEDEDDGLLVST